MTHKAHFLVLGFIHLEELHITLITIPRPVPTWMRVYSWHMVVVGIGGGILSFVNAVMSVEEKLKEGDSCWTVWFE